MRAHRTLIVSVILALALAVPAGAMASRLIIGGSTSVLPLMQKLAAAYHKAYPKIPAPSVSGGESDIGIERRGHRPLRHRRLLARPDQGRRPRGPGLHEDRPRRRVRDHQRRQPRLQPLQKNRSKASSPGKTRDWSEVPGAKITGPIDLFDRNGASGTQDAFQHIFLGEDLKISPSASAEASNGLEQSEVNSDKQAVGFVSFAYTGGVNAVGYEGVACNLRNAKSGQYAGVRNFWMVTKGAPKGEAAKFIDWVTSGNKTTKAIINSSWIAVH